MSRKSPTPNFRGALQNDHQSPIKRRANLYDAVAGRISYHGFRSKDPFHSEHGDAGVSVPPEEVLFRRVNAPTRYMENDFYFANENLSPDQCLPGSDILKAIHTYASDFYVNATTNQGLNDWRSMDETALIAFGILLEEAAKESLGETGDMVFVEGQEISGEEECSMEDVDTKTSGRKRANSRISDGLSGSEAAISTSRRKRKRRHVDG